ncbi:MAG: hypothetical protein U1A73_06975 [Pseudomonas sp.]|nr:hypothetical protein [Pseudomonas sp.]
MATITFDLLPYETALAWHVERANASLDKGKDPFTVESYAQIHLENVLKDYLRQYAEYDKQRAKAAMEKLGLTGDDMETVQASLAAMTVEEVDALRVQLGLPVKG